MEEMGIEEARTHLGEIVDRARYTGEPTFLTRHGKRAAVVVSDEWYRRTLAGLTTAELRERD